jgi:hypothetical protein
LVKHLTNHADRVSQWYRNNNFPNCNGIQSIPSQNNPADFLFLTFIPNPSSGIVRVSLPNNQLPKKIEIFDLSGKLNTVPEIQTHSINLSELSPGVYIAKVYTDANHFIYGKICILK